MPVIAIVIRPGFCRASVARSVAELTGILAFTTSMVELNATRPTPTKSLMGS